MEWLQEYQVLSLTTAFFSGCPRGSYGSNLMHHDKRSALTHHSFKVPLIYISIRKIQSPANYSSPFPCTEGFCGINCLSQHSSKNNRLSPGFPAEPMDLCLCDVFLLTFIMSCQLFLKHTNHYSTQI